MAKQTSYFSNITSLGQKLEKEAATIQGKINTEDVDVKALTSQEGIVYGSDASNDQYHKDIAAAFDSMDALCDKVIKDSENRKVRLDKALIWGH